MHDTGCDELLQRGFLDLDASLMDQINALGIILRASDAAVGSPNIQALCKEMATILIEESPFENASILLKEEDGKDLVLVAAAGIHETLGGGPPLDFNTGLRFGPGEGIVWEVHETQVPRFIEDTHSTPIPQKEGSTVRPGSIVCLPLMGKGVINLSCSQPTEFPPSKKRALVILSNVLAHLISSTDLRERLDASHRYLQQLVDARTEELHRANAKMRASMTYLESVIANAPQGIALLDEDFRILTVNPALLRLMGCTDSDLVGFTPERFFSDKANYSSLMDRLRTEDRAHLTEARIERWNGIPFPAEVHIHSIKDPAGTGKKGIFILHDLTEQKTVADTLLHTEKLQALGAMAGGVAHDFNNLLTSILGNAQLLSRDITDERLRQRIRNIETAVQDGAHTVRRLQAFTGMDRGEKFRGAMDVNAAIYDVMELTRPKWKDDSQRNGITVSFDLALKAERPAAFHSSEFREILTNLVFNAVDAMPEGGTISIRTADADRFVVVEVNDSGVGMPEDVKKRIFDPFFTTKGVGNTGLGLSVSYGLILKARGKITVSSTEGAGATFTLFLPASRGTPAGRPHSPSQENGRSCEILVVDDEAQIVELISLALEQAGHRVTGITDPSRALAALGESRHDILITDLGMPSLSGWDLAREAKKAHPDIKVVLMTGWGAEYEGQDLTDRYVDALLPKPFRLDAIHETVFHLFGHGTRRPS